MIGDRYLDGYIRARQQNEIEGNSADYKTTSQTTLDKIATEATEKYKHGEAFIATISEKEKEQCQKLFVHKHGKYGGGEYLTEDRIDGTWMIVPRYITLIGEVRKLKAILE